MSGRGRPVTVVCHSRQVGGAERWIDQIVLGGAGWLAREHGARFEVVCRPDRSLDAWCGTLEASGIRVHRAGAGPAGVPRLARLLGRSGLVHLNLGHPAGKYQVTSAVLARLAGRRLVVTHHMQIEPRLLGPRWAATTRLLGRLASAHTVLTPAARAMLVERYRYPAARVAVVPTFVDPEAFAPAGPEARRATREELGRSLAGEDWSGDVRLLVTVARLSPEKGLRDLLEVAAASARTEPGWRFLVVGDGPLRGELESAITGRGLRGRVLLAGWQAPATVARWLAAADVMLLPSHFEGLPLTLFEAVACGCPVVVTRVGGVAGLDVPAAAGRVVPPASVPELLAATRNVLGAGPAPDAPEARARLLAPYRRSRVVGQVLDLYDRLLAGRPPRPGTAGAGDWAE